MELSRVQDFDGLLSAMSKTSFQGRNLGRAAEVLFRMFSERERFVVLTISGALTVAQQGPMIIDLIRAGLVDVVVGTGALMTHDMVENMGFSHFEAPASSDEACHHDGLCRVYDSVELESSLYAFQTFLEGHLDGLLEPAPDGGPIGSGIFCSRLGRLLLDHFPDHRSIVSAAAEAGVPVYIPAFTDSEMALDLFHLMVKRNVTTEVPLATAPLVPYNGFRDVYEITRIIEAHTGQNLSIFTLGGGVPRNWTQQVAPALDIMELDGIPVSTKRFSRGVRICPDPPNWGHLSGCTYSEGVSWAKFLPESKGGLYAEVLADATLVLPLLVKGVWQRLEKTGWSPALPPLSAG